MTNKQRSRYCAQKTTQAARGGDQNACREAGSLLRRQGHLTGAAKYDDFEDNNGDKDKDEELFWG